MPPEELESYNSNVGILFQDVARFETGPNKAQVFVDLREGEERERDSETIINELRDELASVPGIRKVQVVRPAAGPVVPAVEIGIRCLHVTIAIKIGFRIVGIAITIEVGLGIVCITVAIEVYRSVVCVTIAIKIGLGVVGITIAI